MLLKIVGKRSLRQKWSRVCLSADFHLFENHAVVGVTGVQLTQGQVRTLKVQIQLANRLIQKRSTQTTLSTIVPYHIFSALDDSFKKVIVYFQFFFSKVSCTYVQRKIIFSLRNLKFFTHLTILVLCLWMKIVKVILFSDDDFY